MNCDSNMLNSLALDSLHILQSSWDKEKKYIYKWKKLPLSFLSLLLDKSLLFMK